VILKKIFNRLDTDSSGTIDKAELMAAISELDGQATADDIIETMKEIDEDNDGQVTFTELKAWWKKGR
jgi:Ca2+-binding EF-hand superfamily protein